jgi:RNA polymerase sigma factor (TIGR02999 family)
MADGNVTRLLEQMRHGDAAAQEQLLPLVYDELRKIAAGYMRREREGHTLQPTALVNEAYLRLVKQPDVDWQNRAHFFGVAAQFMRRILVDHARRKNAGKRGGVKVTLDEAMASTEGRDDVVLGVDRALEKLSRLDARQSRIVELRFFAGLSVEETALVLGVAPRTVNREWRMAQAWLRNELETPA